MEQVGKEGQSVKVISRRRVSALQGVHSKRVVLLSKVKQCDKSVVRRSKKSLTSAPQGSSQKKSAVTKTKQRPQLLLSKSRNINGSDFFTSGDIERALKQTTYSSGPSNAFFEKLRLPQKVRCEDELSSSAIEEPVRLQLKQKRSHTSLPFSFSVSKACVRKASQDYNAYTLNPY